MYRKKVNTPHQEIRKRGPRDHQCIIESSNLASGKGNRSGSSGYQKERNNLKDSYPEDSPQLKILNTETDVTFLNICDTFEKILNEIDLVKDDSVYEKLVIINKLIEKKIFSIKIRKSKYGSSSSLASTALSLDLIHDDLDDEKFWKAIICPFCAEFQDNKTNLVNHIDDECSLSLMKKKNEQIPFAEFQILPNNTFKCNICHNLVFKNLNEYFIHKQDRIHLQAFNEASTKKFYSECLFCSCCRILVYNSFMQIKFHISHEEHEKRKNEIRNSQFYRSQGIHCLFDKNKKFKCLNCTSAEYQTPKNLLKHLEAPSHLKGGGNQIFYNSLIFCCVCNLAVHMFEIISHFTNSSIHKENELKKGRKTFELCNYCGCVCDSLMDLFLHMKSNCKEIQNIKGNLGTSSKPKTNKGTKTDMNETKKKSTSSEFYITVKDYTNIKELFDCFKKFGEIMSMEAYNDKDVIIRFREKKVVADILLLQNVIKIGDEKLKIISGNPNKPNMMNKHDQTEMESSNVNHREEKEEKKVEVLTPPIAEKSDNSSSVGPLDALFERVSLHLKNNTKMSDSNDEKKILIDCRSTLNIESCDLVGFSGCELSFPFESVNLFCDLKKFSLNYLNTPTKNLLLENRQALLSSQLWGDVELFSQDGPYPYIKCVHEETQRTCTITFTRSMMLLTSMLRDCMGKNDLVQHFCLILRFWLSVHELKVAECEYTVIALVVFFFTYEGILELSSAFKDKEYLKDKFANFKVPSRHSESEIGTVKKLFQKFLQFLRAFDFKNHAICLPTSQPISKTIFTSPAYQLLTGVQNSAHLYSLKNCSMCIVDPISFQNLAADINQRHLQAFLDIVDSTVCHYDIYGGAQNVGFM